ncbi:lysophospholipase [Peniophora sp. CONT]|nr:lysophospholipase [Peniophora sp. CONT]
MSATSSFTEAWLVGPFATKFYTRLYKPPASTPTRAVLVFVHGYLEHVGRYEAAHTRWASRGVAVFAYDERGFGQTALGKQKSPGAGYGRTGGVTERMSDIEWALRHAREEVPGVPLFLMGHSMGGGQVLSFATRTQTPPSKEIIQSLSGVIASSPLVRVVRRAPSPIFLKILSLLSKVLPNVTLSTPVQDEDLSHDPNVGPDSLKDPWIMGQGSIEGLVDMLSRGELLLTEGYRLWPQKLPVLILHGDQDMVNSFSACKDFFGILQAPDKSFVEYKGMMHDLMTEPDIKEKYFEDCYSWVDKRVPT